MPLAVGGVAALYLLITDISPFTKGLLLIWFFSLLFITLFYWKRECPPARLMTLPVLLGLFAFVSTELEFLNGFPFKGIVISILAALILCGSLHSMTLGHHYLNVRGLPIKHLTHANNALWALLGLRLLWDFYNLFFGKMVYGGDTIPLILFSLKFDGFLLWIGIFFGTFLPFIALFFVREEISAVMR